MAGEGEGTRRPKTGEGGTSFGWGEAGVSAADVLGHRLKPGLQDLDQMMTVDGWVQAMHGALTWPIRRLTWSVVEAAGDTGEADDVRDQLAPLLPRIVAGSSQGIGHGVAFAEIVWQDDGAGGLYIDDVAFRPISTCKPERRRSGRVLGFKQVAHTPDFSGAINETFLVSERKAFVYAHDSTTNPGIGRSAFETAYQYYKDKRKILFYRFKNLEKFGGASIHGKMENASNPELRRQFESAMAELRNGGVAVTGLKDEVALLQSPNAGVAFRQAITDQNFEMAVSALVQWLAYAQEGNSGSYNASEVQMDLLRDVTGGRVAEMQDAINVLPRHICEVNRGPGAAVPTVEAEVVDEDQKKAVKDAGEKFLSWEHLPAWMRVLLPEAYALQMGLEKPEGADESTRGEAGSGAPENTDQR